MRDGLLGGNRSRGYRQTAGMTSGRLTLPAAAGYARSKTEPGKGPALTKDELAVVRTVLAASGDEWEIAEALGRRRLTDEERKHVGDLLVPEMLNHGLDDDGSLPPQGRAIDDLIGKLMSF
jgi:hypothetical protein